MATEFKLELDIKDLTKSIDALGSIGSQLDSVVRKIKDAQDKVAAKNMGGLTKLVNAVKRKQKELAEAFGNSKLGKFLNRRMQDVKLIGKVVSGVADKLNKALSVARNIGLAMLGAASAALYFSKGTTKEHSDARSQGFSSLSDKKSFEYANKRTGRDLDMSAFNNALYTNTEGYDAFATLGLSKSEFLEMANKKGSSAAFAEFMRRITKQYQSGAWENDNKEVYSHKMDALAKLFSIADAGGVKSFFGSTEYGSSTDWLNSFQKNIWRGISHENLIKNDRAMVDLGEQLVMLKNRFVDLFAPELEKAVKGITEGLQRLHKWLNSEEGKEAMQKFKDGLSQMAALIKNVIIGGLVGLAKLLNKTGMINLDQGTLEWLESLTPQRSFQQTADEASKSILRYIPGTDAYKIHNQSQQDVRDRQYADDLAYLIQTANDPTKMTSLSPDARVNLKNALKFANEPTTDGRTMSARDTVNQVKGELVKIEINNNSDANITVTKQIAAGGR